MERIDSEDDSFGILVRICCFSSKCDKQDSFSVVSEAVQLLSSSESNLRAIGLQVISRLVSVNCNKDIEGRLLTAIDKLPSISGRISSNDELEGCLCLIKALNVSVADALCKRFENLCPKLVIMNIKNISTYSLQISGLRIIQEILNTRFSPLLVPNLPSIRRAAIPLLFQSDLQLIATNIISRTYNIETTDLWQYAWGIYSFEVIRVMHSINQVPRTLYLDHLSKQQQFDSASNKDSRYVAEREIYDSLYDQTTAKNANIYDSSTALPRITNVNGAQKAIRAERIFRGTIATLSEVTVPTPPSPQIHINTKLCTFCPK